ncbi:hypothetical protein CL684_00680 [Candidatus Campbellbacteria bacterium]|nr:hypothetical protein [Candidatus Campbellbacteria bacterium]|tara:strand:+ start:5334 stop:6983 length:1650 start_codon:yes stop_codon:yes gene_type:complete
MKKFLTQKINFRAAAIFLLFLVAGVSTISAAAPGGSLNAVVHRSGGDQAIQSLQLGPCSGGGCNALGDLDARGLGNGLAYFAVSDITNALLYSSNTSFLLDKVFVGEYDGQPASASLPIWSTTQTSGASRGGGETATLQSVNVGGSVIATNLTNSGGLPSVCFDEEGTLIICESTPSNGLCGFADGGSYSSAPSSGLCFSGSAGAVSGGSGARNDDWAWTCFGSNGGTDDQCSANYVPGPTNGQCGSSDGQSFSQPPTSGLCSPGSASTVNDNGPLITPRYTWSCAGYNGGTTDDCDANYQAGPIDGQCKNYPFGPYGTEPATNTSTGCDAGTFQDISDTGSQWRWRCLGQNGGSNSPTCTAARANGNPQCTSHPGTHATQPATNSSNGCDVGSYSDTGDTGSQWRWTCTDQGVTQTCSANKEANTGYLFVCGTDPDGVFGATQSAPNNSRYGQWTRGGTYSPQGTGDEFPFNMGTPDCSNPTTIPFWTANPWSLPNGQDGNNPANDGYDGSVLNPNGQGDRLWYKFFCLDGPPDDCFCNTAAANENMC